MKVLFVCPFVPWPLVNGGKVRTFNLLKAASAFAEVHLRVIREPGMDAGAEDALRPHCATLAFFERGRPGSWMRWSRPRLERWFHSPALQAAVQLDVDTGGFHLVHLDELLLARIVEPRGRRVPMVQHHHKLDTVLYDTLHAGRGPHRFFDLWKLHRLEAESARRYRHHLTCSEEDARILRERHGALDCHAVPSGFDPAFFRPPEPAPHRDPLSLLFLGSMDYGPNVDAARLFAAECMPALRARHPGVRFQIVGGDPAPEVKALAGPDVVVTGAVPDVRPHLLGCGQLVVPLRIGGGTRLKIVEALAMGTPVVSTPIGAEGLGLADGHDLLLAADPQAMVEAVSSGISDPEAAERRAGQGRRSVHDRYRWEVLGHELAEYWERVAFSGAVSPSR